MALSESSSAEPMDVNSHQPFPWPNSPQEPEGWKAEQLAAEAMASDLSKWIVFDPSECGADEIDKFLQINSPSVIQRSDGIGWISVLGPQFMEERPWQVEDEDKEGLQQAWEDMQNSGRPITFETVLDLARAHKCLSGKWLFHMDTGIKVDHAWASIAKAVVSGECGMSAKVSPHEDDGRARPRHVICVYNWDFTDEDTIIELEAGIRRAGIKCHMTYKPDAFTYMGIYRNNKWSLRPAIYASEYDLSHRRSKVTAVYETKR
ncbi:UPF0696 protein C11orf68 homolog [Amphiura filiformis]|uniref:UPF0696 protein C11orf68 homolog n=1 Tax=Amphiura filiformis TaxID=82378 RepID=UPI003B2154D0